MEKILNLKLVLLLEYLNIKIILQVYTPHWSEEIFGIKKIKNTVLWTYVFVDLNGDEIVGNFYKKIIPKNKLKWV